MLSIMKSIVLIPFSMIKGDYIRLPCFTTKPRFWCIIPCRITSINSQLQTEVVQIERIPTYIWDICENSYKWENNFTGVRLGGQVLGSDGSMLNNVKNYVPINPFPSEWVLRALIDFTLSNARRFYSSMGNLLDGKGLRPIIITITVESQKINLDWLHLALNLISPTDVKHLQFDVISVDLKPVSWDWLSVVFSLGHTSSLFAYLIHFYLYFRVPLAPQVPLEGMAKMEIR